MRCLPCSLALVALLAASTAEAAVVWNESVNGDISGNRLVPTSVALGTGSSNVIGSVKAGELDYLTVTVPVNTQLTKIILENYASADSTAFIGLQAGSTFTEPPTGTDVANLLGYTHIGESLEDTDILDNIAAGAGAQGFTPPLGPGPYTFWIQQTGSSITAYELSFLVTPEPSTLLLAGAGSAAALLYRMRMRRRGSLSRLRASPP